MRRLKKFVMAVFFIICLVSVPIIETSLIGMENVQAASKIKISAKKVYISKGKKTKLYIKGTKSKVKWSSTNKRIATVNSKGIVKGVKKGTTKIIAKVGKKQYSCKVYVETPSINNKNINLSIGKNVTLKMNGTKQKVTWSSSNKKIASVNKKGIVKGIKKGNATITANVGGKKYTCKITVKPEVVEITDFNVPESIVVRLGGVKTISISFAPSNATETFSPSFSSENLNIATVTGEGIISPISLGETNIKVKFKTIEKTIKVIVEKSKQTLINEENQRYDAEVNEINRALNTSISVLQWDYEYGYTTESQYNMELRELYLINNQRLDDALKTHNQNLENINSLPD